MRIWIVLIVLLAGCQTQPSKEYFGNWETGPYSDGSFSGVSGKLRYAVVYSDKTAFHLATREDCNTAARLVYKDDPMIKDAPISVFTRVDEEQIQEHLATLVMNGKDNPHLSFYLDQKAIKRLMSGKTLRIKADDAIFKFDLSGADKALDGHICHFK